ncbi:hypothetical protein L6164_023079 [Bauhinia variegata]|uniref:Uncharacterized protein n=1 Tax=Bauhinia variegata TaxID=167791 RepID=A0ACB9MKL3_BAUVA|nr:hypothetical protein L6164_023079 [Bauhinia variegata]
MVIELSPGLGSTYNPGLLGSPYQWLREQRLGSNTGLNLIGLLRECAHHVACGKIKNADMGLDYISQLASPDGDSVQRVATYFSQALACRIVKQLAGVSNALNSAETSSISEEPSAHNYFFNLCPFLKVAYLVTNQAIVEAMEEEKMVHIIDLHSSEPAQWVDLMQTWKKRREGPPHLKITGIHEKKQVLSEMAFHLAREAGKIDFPLQFCPVVSKLEDLDFESLPVKRGEALAISSVLQLHCFLATDDKMLGRNSPAPSINLHRAVHINEKTFRELLDQKDMIHGYLRPDSSLPPLPLSSSPKMEIFLNALRKLQPKIMVITEPESNLNVPNLVQRFDEALHYYSALFDCLESSVSRTSLERQKLESMLLGEEIKNIIACEGLERRYRFEKLERWIPRLQMAGFGRVPFSYTAKFQPRRLLESYDQNHKYKLQEENDCLLICRRDTPLFSISAWKFGQ